MGRHTKKLYEYIYSEDNYGGYSWGHLWEEVLPNAGSRSSLCEFVDETMKKRVGGKDEKLSNGVFNEMVN